MARLPGVEIVGNGGDLRGLLRHAAVAVSPSGDANGALQGALEAMAAGVPLVASLKSLNGPWAKFDREVYVKDSPWAMARRLVELLSSESMRAEVGSRARAFVRVHYSWEAAAVHVAQVVDRVVGITPRASRPAATLEAPANP